MNKFLVAVFAAAFSISALAGDGPADNITSLDGDGNGTYVDSYVDTGGTGADHPFYTFNADAGTTVTIQLDSDVENAIWVFDILDDNAEIGDANGVDYTQVDNTGGGNSNTLNFIAPTAGQYIVQVDSFFGADTVNYTLTISGATSGLPTVENVPTLQQWGLIVLMLVLAGVAVARMRQSA